MIKKLQLSYLLYNIYIKPFFAVFDNVLFAFVVLFGMYKNSHLCKLHKWNIHSKKTGTKFVPVFYTYQITF